MLYNIFSYLRPSPNIIMDWLTISIVGFLLFRAVCSLLLDLPAMWASGDRIFVHWGPVDFVPEPDFVNLGTPLFGGFQNTLCF